jgi:hypothetical protein
MDLSNPPRISRAIRFREQCRAFGIRGQHGFQQGSRTRRRFLRHMTHARTGREPDLTPIRLQFTHNGTQQSGFAGAIAANEANLAPNIHLQGGTFEQSPPAKTNGEITDGQNSHGRGLWRSGRDASKG